MGNKAKHGIIFWILGLFFSPYNWKWHWRKVSCLFYINPFCFSCNCLCILWFKKSKLESHLSKCSLKSWRLWGKFVQREAGFFIKFWRFWPEREHLDNYPHAFFNRWKWNCIDKILTSSICWFVTFLPRRTLREILQFFVMHFIFKVFSFQILPKTKRQRKELHRRKKRLVPLSSLPTDYLPNTKHHYAQSSPPLPWSPSSCS